MGLNKSTGNMYEFVTHTFNIIKGACFHDCSYCYMKRWGKLNPPRFDNKEIKTDLGKDNFIFVGSSIDMFAENIPDDWIACVLNYLNKFDNKYLIQTKNPKRILDFRLPKSVICTTLESDIFYPEIMKESPNPYERAKYMNMLSDMGFETYVTIEPILDFNLMHFVSYIKRCRPSQVNIGCDSGNHNLPEPSKEKVIQLISELEKFTTIHNKSNLKRLLK
jgi:DNA repair photolyase